MTYHVPCLTSGTGLVDITPAAGPTQTPEAAVQLDDLEPRYGDVTGDGRTDAVVRLGCLFVNGGNAYVSSVALVTSERDGAHQLGAAVDGFDPVVVGSRVAVARAVYAPEDARCCPSTTRYVPLTFQGDHWVEGGVGGQPLTTAGTVTTTGIGALQVGKPYGELAASLGQPVVVTNGIDSNECVYVTVEGGRRRCPASATASTSAPSSSAPPTPAPCLASASGPASRTSTTRSLARSPPSPTPTWSPMGTT